MHLTSRHIRRGAASLLTASCLCIGLMSNASAAVGTWQELTPPSGVDPIVMIQLLDGSILFQNDDSANWYKLTPDASGNYLTGTWSEIAPMAASRLYYGSVVFPDGRLMVAGGEYSSAGSETTDCEIYDPLANTWTQVGGPPGFQDVGDVPMVLLTDGNALLGNILNTTTAGWDPVANTWFGGPNMLSTEDSSTEESWQLLPDGTVLTVNCYGTIDDAQKYDPISDSWITAGTAPAIVQQSSAEVGAEVLTPAGTVVALGSTGKVGIYTPPANPSNPGTWAAAPNLPLSAGKASEAKDAPADMMPNGNILITIGPSEPGENYGSPVAAYEFNPVAMTYAAAPTPPNTTNGNPPYVGRMLQAPTGQVYYSFETDSTSGGVQVYTPVGSPNSSWAPTISSVAVNPDNSYRVTGTQLNGLSYGASYGDDADSMTNYPLVRISNPANGHVLYARTFNRSTSGIVTGSTPVYTDFQLPANLDKGPFNLSVVANGIASAPVSFQPTPKVGVISINSGGGTIGLFQADSHVTGGTEATPYTGQVDMSKVTDPAPIAVYQSERDGAMTYSFHNLTKGATYLIRLHFTEDTYSAPGDRKFNVTINGKKVMTDYDIYADAGAEHTATIKEFNVKPSAAGSIVIKFVSVIAQPKVDGIQVELP